MGYNRPEIDAAIARLSGQGNSAVRAVLDNCRRLGIQELVAACENELALRGTLELSAEQARTTEAARASVEGRPLEEVIEIAFTAIPPHPEERLLIDWIGEHPGTSYRETLATYKKGDLSLVIGHLVYYRFGYFRSFIIGKTQSDLLLHRESSPEGIRYTLRNEAVAAFRKLGLLSGGK